MDAVTLHYARLVFAVAAPIYDVHRDLSRALGKRDVAGCLYRTDVDRTGAIPRRVALVQSREPGDWAALGGRLVESRTTERTWRFAGEQRYRFFLRANATHAVKATDRVLGALRGDAFRAVRGKRVEVRGYDALIGWLRRQGTTHGFALHETPFAHRPDDDTASLIPVPAVRISTERDVDWRADGRSGHHVGTDFEGVLTVRDPSTFAAAVRDGIGPAKAFGFGLLSLAAANAP